MNDAHRRYLAAYWWGKPRNLASPFQLARYLSARLFRGLRFGPATAWVLFSISAWLLCAAVTIYVASNRFEAAAEERRGRELFSTFGDNPLQALQQFDNAGLPVRRVFLRTVLESSSNSDRLQANLFGTEIALSHLDDDDIRSLFRDVISPVLQQPQTDGHVLFMSAALMLRWGVASLLTSSDVEVPAKTLTDRINTQTDAFTLGALAAALGALGKNVSADKIDAAARKLIDQMDQGKIEREFGISADKMRGQVINELLTSLGLFGGKLSTDKVDVVVKKVVDQMVKEKKESVVENLASTLNAFTGRVTPETAGASAEMLVNEMLVEKNEWLLGDLARALNVLASQLSISKADELARKLLDRMSKEEDTTNLLHPESTLVGLAAGLGAFGKTLNADTVNAAADILTDKLGRGKAALRSHDLAFGLAALGDKVSTEKIDASAKRVMDEIVAGGKDSFNVEFAATTLTALGRRVDADTINRAATVLVNLMSSASALGGEATLGNAQIRRGDIAGSSIYGLVLALNALGDRVDADKLNAAARELARFPDVPCVVVLREHGVRETRGLHELSNPACEESRWNQLALGLAVRTGQPFATGNLSEPEGVKVDFPKLCDYVRSQEPWLDRWKLAWPQVASIVLLFVSTAAFACGLICSRQTSQS
jgi:hypothetical protein